MSARVEAILAESAQWTGRKQQLTATRLHRLLVEEGHRVGVTLAKPGVTEWKRRRRSHSRRPTWSSRSRGDA